MGRPAKLVKTDIETPAGKSPVEALLPATTIKALADLFANRAEMKDPAVVLTKVQEILKGRAVPVAQLTQLQKDLEMKPAAFAPIRKLLGVSKATYDATVTAAVDLKADLKKALGSNATQIAGKMQLKVMEGVPLDVAISTVVAEAKAAAKSQAVRGAELIHKIQSMLRDDANADILAAVVWLKTEKRDAAKAAEFAKATIANFKSLAC